MPGVYPPAEEDTTSEDNGEPPEETTGFSGDDLGPALARRRSELGLSLREVSRRSAGALSDTGLYRIEAGLRYPTLRSLQALADVYRVRIVVEPGHRLRLEEAGADNP